MAASFGSTVSANKVFRVLAGASLRWASLAASTLPLEASATSQDSAVSDGTSGAPGCGRTWVPSPYSRAGWGTAALGAGGAGSPARWVAAPAAGARASVPATHRAQAVDTVRLENPVIIRST